MFRIAVALGMTLAALVGCYRPSRTLATAELGPCVPSSPAPDTLRVVSYNMKAGVVSSFEDIATLLESLEPDLVALQEVDRGVRRTGRSDQALDLGERLGLHSAFAGARRRQGGDFGVAVLSRFPFARAERVSVVTPSSFQPRVFLDTTVCVGEGTLRVVSIHADVVPSASHSGIDALLEVLAPDVGRGILLAGDLNVRAHTRGPQRLLEAGFTDVLGEDTQIPTYRGVGRRRIDYIFADGPLAAAVGLTGVVQTRKSDHYPVLADFALDAAWGE